MRKLSIRRALVGLFALIVPVALVSAALAQAPTLTDLGAPRNLSVGSGGSHLVFGEMSKGQIVRVSELGTITVIADGLPTAIEATPEGDLPAGVTSVIEVGGTYYYTVGEGSEPGFDAVYSVKPGQAPVLVADLEAYEIANNPDGDVDESGEPELLTNPYDLVSDNAGGLYVSASGGNTIYHVASDGTISPFAIFENRENPLFPGLGGPTMDQVPTGIEWGPDGALYVSTLTGFPFPTGEARVYRIEDLSLDGDALDDGEVTIFAEGLTTATNLAFDTDGSLLVTEMSTNLLEGAPGRLVRVVNGVVSNVVAEPLVSPTGITIFNGEVVVSQEFLGIVAEASAGAAITASLPPPPAEGGEGGVITPPNTGDAGLAAGTSSSLTLLLAVALVAAVAVGGRALINVRR